MYVGICTWRSEDNLWELVLSFYSVSSRVETPVLSSGLTISALPLSHLNGLLVGHAKDKINSTESMLSDFD